MCDRSEGHDKILRDLLENGHLVGRPEDLCGVTRPGGGATWCGRAGEPAACVLGDFEERNQTHGCCFNAS